MSFKPEVVVVLPDDLERAVDRLYEIIDSELGQAIDVTPAFAGDLESFQQFDDWPDVLVIDGQIGPQASAAWAAGAMPFGVKLIAVLAEPGTRPDWAHDHFNRPFDRFLLAARIQQLIERRRANHV